MNDITSVSKEIVDNLIANDEYLDIDPCPFGNAGLLTMDRARDIDFYDSKLRELFIENAY